MRLATLLLMGNSAVSAQPPAQKKTNAPPPIVPKAEELALIRGKVDDLENMLRTVDAAKANPDAIVDVEVYAKAGLFPLEFPQTFFTQDQSGRRYTR